uniref:Uncharacterized protein n=1 Tax=Acrobeloides nanus TaxID=290746 RepID=A0A914CCY7_9BILA
MSNLFSSTNGTLTVLFLNQDNSAWNRAVIWFRIREIHTANCFDIYNYGSLKPKGAITHLTYNATSSGSCIYTLILKPVGQVFFYDIDYIVNFYIDLRKYILGSIQKDWLSFTAYGNSESLLSFIIPSNGVLKTSMRYPQNLNYDDKITFSDSIEGIMMATSDYYPHTVSKNLTCQSCYSWNNCSICNATFTLQFTDVVISNSIHGYLNITIDEKTQSFHNINLTGTSFIVNGSNLRVNSDYSASRILIQYKADEIKTGPCIDIINDCNQYTNLCNNPAYP